MVACPSKMLGRVSSVEVWHWHRQLVAHLSVSPAKLSLQLFSYLWGFHIDKKYGSFTDLDDENEVLVIIVLKRDLKLKGCNLGHESGDKTDF
jgi:hypothetical protein